MHIKNITYFFFSNTKKKIHQTSIDHHLQQEEEKQQLNFQFDKCACVSMFRDVFFEWKSLSKEKPTYNYYYFGSLNA